MSLSTRLSDLAYAIGTDMKQFRVWMTGSSTGDLNGLTTTNRSNFVAAINEVKAGSSGAPPDATETTKGIVELADLAEMAAGVDTTRVVTPAGVRQERLALKTEILGAGVPAALDTLDELAAALGDDANFGATMTTALGNRLRVDTAAQGLTPDQQSNARTNIGAVGSAELGNTDVDLVAVYVAAKT